MSTNLSSIDATRLLDTAKYLNSVLRIGKQSDLTNKIQEKQNNIEVQKTTLADLKDAITTTNRDFIEKEKLQKNTPNATSTMQDWSLFIFFVGYGTFALGCLIYIFRMPAEKHPFISSLVYIFLNVLVYVFFVYILQRFG